uniref:Uncharacterized protein n=1 Tax=Anguilla anguilla TaxID=7936 RepID=A0A0E9XB19_ANGAN
MHMVDYLIEHAVILEALTLAIRLNIYIRLARYKILASQPHTSLLCFAVPQPLSSTR